MAPADIRVADSAGHLFAFDEAGAKAFIAANPGAHIVEPPPHPEEGTRAQRVEAARAAAEAEALAARGVVMEDPAVAGQNPSLPEGENGAPVAQVGPGATQTEEPVNTPAGDVTATPAAPTGPDGAETPSLNAPPAPRAKGPGRPRKG